MPNGTSRIAAPADEPTLPTKHATPGNNAESTVPATFRNPQPCLRLSERWRILHDPDQWIVQRYRAGRWRSIGFVVSTKKILMRVLRENGAVIDAEADFELDDWPATFRQWRDDWWPRYGVASPETGGQR